MRNILTSALLPALVLCGAATAGAAEFGTTKADRALRLASTRLETGERTLSRADDLRTRAARLDALQKASYHLRQARAIVSLCDADSRCTALRETADDRLVRALDDQAIIYFERGSHRLAMKRVQEALAIDPERTSSRNLLAAIRAAESRDPLEGSSNGSRFVQRARDRRAGIGLPFRERGVGLRRF